MIAVISDLHFEEEASDIIHGQDGRADLVFRRNLNPDAYHSFIAQMAEEMRRRKLRQFDLVIAIGFWDYVADPLPRLQVIRSISQGRFLSAWPREGTWRAAARKARLSVAGCPVYFWTRSQVDEYLRRAGFRVESCEIYGQLYCVESTVL